MESEDVREFLKNSNAISHEKRYRIDVTSLFLHYLFKDENEKRRRIDE
ncbi:HTH domain-containing protein [Paenibacillus faecalis]